MGIFGLKVYHLATLDWTRISTYLERLFSSQLFGQCFKIYLGIFCICRSWSSFPHNNVYLSRLCNIQGCQIFLGPTYQNGEKYNERPCKNITNCCKIFQMAIKDFFHSKVLHNIPECFFGTFGMKIYHLATQPTQWDLTQIFHNDVGAQHEISVQDLQRRSRNAMWALYVKNYCYYFFHKYIPQKQVNQVHMSNSSNV
jgi:hypothetical protein